MRSQSVATAIILILVSFGAGYAFHSIQGRLRSIGEASLAGQTLTDLARALAVEKLDHAVYPESIETLKVASSSGDFSPELLRRIVYHKAGDTYVAFVGLPGVAYIRPGEAAQIRLK